MAQTPQTILDMIEALGGRRIFAMAFEGSAYDGAYKLTLRIAKPLVRGTKGKATHVDVELDADLYTVNVYRIGNARSGYRRTEIYKASDIYADRLREVVEDATGLALTLGTMSAVCS